MVLHCITALLNKLNEIELISLLTCLALISHVQQYNLNGLYQHSTWHYIVSEKLFNILGLWISSVTGISGSFFQGNDSTSLRAPGTSDARTDESFERKSMAECPFLSFSSTSLELFSRLWARAVAICITCKPDEGTAMMTYSRILWTKLLKIMMQKHVLILINTKG